MCSHTKSFTHDRAAVEPDDRFGVVWLPSPPEVSLGTPGPFFSTAPSHHFGTFLQRLSTMSPDEARRVPFPS